MEVLLYNKIEKKTQEMWYERNVVLVDNDILEVSTYYMIDVFFFRLFFVRHSFRRHLVFDIFSFDIFSFGVFSFGVFIVIHFNLSSVFTGMYALRRNSLLRNKDCRMKVYRKAFLKQIGILRLMITIPIISISVIFLFNNHRRRALVARVSHCYP